MAKVDKQSDIIARYEKEMRMHVREINRLKAEKKKMQKLIEELQKTVTEAEKGKG